MNYLKVYEEFGGYKVNYGLGNAFTDDKNNQYLKLKTDSKVYWAVYSLSENKIVAESTNSTVAIYGASVPKVVAAGVALDTNGGVLPDKEGLIKRIGSTIRCSGQTFTISESGESYLENLLIHSKNNPNWAIVTKLAGNGEAIDEWCRKRGYTGMFPGNYYTKSAPSNKNSVSARGMCLFWADVLNNKFTGGKTIESITNACGTSATRSRKYIPKDYRIGSKTGYYDTYYHDSGWIDGPNGKFTITVLTEKNMESVAILWGGLFKEYCLVPKKKIKLSQNMKREED
jgi:hypothetical protein